MSLPILTVEGLSKSFRSHWTFRQRPAVKDLSFTLNHGEALGFLGANGAGKTTTLKCILGLVAKSSGRILLEGEPLARSSQHAAIGYLPELPYFYEHLTVEETVLLAAALHGQKRGERIANAQRVIERVGLGDRTKSNVRQLSKGLQQRLAFAQAIVNSPRLLLLDEPFSGLDPVGRLEMRELLLDLREGGTTLLLSSHVLSDVEEICDRISIMAEGTLRTAFAMKEIPALFGEHFELVVRLDESHPALSAVVAGADDVSTRLRGEERVVTIRFGTYELAERALSTLMESHVRVEEFHAVRPRLEEIFVQVTERSGGDGDGPPAAKAGQQEASP